MTPPPFAPELPAILEIKRTLDGRERRFDCRLLASGVDGRHVAVLWVAPAAMHVHGVDLPAGTVSEWRDLTVDVLALPGGRLDVVDEHELPAELAPDVAAHIDAGKQAILAAPNAVMEEIEAASRAALEQPGHALG
jgi:hypothetical protein